MKLYFPACYCILFDYAHPSLNVLLLFPVQNLLEKLYLKKYTVSMEKYTGNISTAQTSIHIHPYIHSASH